MRMPRGGVKLVISMAGHDALCRVLGIVDNSGRLASVRCGQREQFVNSKGLRAPQQLLFGDRAGRPGSGVRASVMRVSGFQVRAEGYRDVHVWHHVASSVHLADVGRADLFLSGVRKVGYMEKPGH